jgi:two-component system OmpR family response regulator
MTVRPGIWHEPRIIAPPPSQAAARRQVIMVVEDDADIAAMIADMLGERGYDVLRAGDGTALERYLQSERIDLVVLDLMLPGEDGLSLCRRLRTRHGVPILMLTAIGAEADRIVGLESGADDYMVKPFAPRELLARVCALLRRTGGAPVAAPVDEVVSYHFAGWELNLLRLSLTAPDGALVTLTSAEFSLLAALCARAGQVVSREVLLARDGNPTPAAFDRSVDTLIGRLRRKLAGVAPGGEIIRTVRHAGYMLMPPVTVRRRATA